MGFSGSMRPDLAVVGLIGPTNLVRIARASGVPAELYQECAFEAGAAIARHNAILAVVPDRGVALDGFRGYTGAHGPWSIGLVPDGGPSDSVATSNCRRGGEECDEIIDGFTWHHQHAALCQLSDLMICVGLSCGTIAEIAWTKWVGGPRVLALRQTFTAIPQEILAETDVIMIDDLGSLDDALRRELEGVRDKTSISGKRKSKP
jgi:predicted Rossmann-fold nucleotide-binding protein